MSLMRLLEITYNNCISVLDSNNVNMGIEATARHWL